MDDNLTRISNQDASVTRAYIKLTIHWEDQGIIGSDESRMILDLIAFNTRASMEHVADKRRQRFIIGLLASNAALITGAIGSFFAFAGQ